MPRTRISDTNIRDVVNISELELNEFFESVVITGTETETELLQRFNEYFPGQGIIQAGANITVTTGTTSITIASTGGGGGGGSSAFIGAGNIVVISGVPTAGEVTVSGEPNNQFEITQPSHGFSPGTAIFHTGSEWTAAKANDSETLGTHIVQSTSGDNFVVIQVGRTTIESHGLTVGEYYFVTATGTSGTLDVDEPSSGFSNPLVYVEGSDIVHVLPFRPSAIAPSSSSGEYSLIRDEKTSGTDGGTFTSGAWRTRDLNTIVVSGTTGVELDSNQLTLPGGTYRIDARAPAHFVNTHKARLQNITDGTTVDEGSSEKSNDDTSQGESTQASIIRTQFTIATFKAFEIQHQCQTTTNTNGFGVATTFSTNNEIYTIVEILKVT